MNDCLLMKWWWRFGTERTALWRQVICCKYQLDDLSWLPSVESLGRVSIIWKDILMVGQREGNMLRLFMDNVNIVMGDGCKIRFWTDVWLHGVSLKSLFPRIFCICTQKSIVVAEALQGGVAGLSSSLKLRRSTFSWEGEEWNNFMDLMRGVVLQREKADSLKWEADQSLIFSVKSFYRCVEAEVGSLRMDLLPLWKNYAPPKVQFLGWLAVLGRVKTADLLFSLGILADFNDSLCHFCGVASETVEHLFLHCGEVWAIWSKVLSWWRFCWVVPGSIKACFDWWLGWKFKKAKKVLWELSFYAVLWSIWKARNEFIFQGTAPRWEEMGDIIKHRIGYWFKAFQGSKEVSSDDILFRFPSLIESL